MTYATYSFLRDHLDREIGRVYREYATSTVYFIDASVASKAKSLKVRDAQAEMLERMQQELKAAAQAVAATSKDQAMREFWGVGTKSGS